MANSEPGITMPVVPNRPPVRPNDIEAFKKELTVLINRYCLDSMTNTPDFLLADHLIRTIEIYDHTAKKNKAWHQARQVESP